MEEYDEVRLVLDEHALSSTLESQSVLGLRKVCRIREEVVGAVRVCHSCALDIDAYNCFCLERMGLAWCIGGVYPVDGEEKVDTCKALGEVSVKG